MTQEPNQIRDSAHFVYITMDGGHNAALRTAAAELEREYGIRMNLSLHRSPDLKTEADWQRLENDIDRADFIFGCMIFGEDQVRPLQKILEDRETPTCFITSNPAIIRTTRLGKFVMKPQEEADSSPGPLKRMMNWLRPKKGRSEGKSQTALLQNLTKVMKYIPGKARDIHTFVAMHDYWLHSTPENLKRMMCLLLDRYVDGFAGRVPVQDAVKYPDAALYHPDAPAPFEDMESYRAWRIEQGLPVSRPDNEVGAAGILTMRAVILSGNTNPLDAQIRAIEAHGIETRTIYSAILDYRPAMEKFLLQPGADDARLGDVDVLLQGMGFPLVGGMAGSQPDKAAAILSELDVGYFDLIPLAFQNVEEWRTSQVGLMPIHTAMNIALPELDGSAEPVVFGGPTRTSDKHAPNQPEIDQTARRIARRVRLRRKQNAEKRIAIVLFNFPPNMGNAGTAMYLDVFNSIQRLLQEMAAAGYDVEVPGDVDELRRRVVEGNATRHGTDCNVADQLPVGDYQRLFPAYTAIEEHWGYPPGELLNDGRNFHILGAHFGKVFVGVQPSFGYEGDPMRLLMGTGCSPHHGFAAFYAWLDHVYDADAVLHFGTHGALEFMPGKQNGLGADDWPHRLLGSLPNYYYYCVNNPSEASIAKRRGAATLISYMVPPLQQAGLYKGLRLLKDSLESYRQQPDPNLLEDIRTQAERLGISVGEAKAEAGTGHNGASNGYTNGNTNGHANGRPAAFTNGNLTVDASQYTNGHSNGQTNGIGDEEAYITALNHELIQVEHRMIPLGLHVLGQPPSSDELVDILALVAAFYRIPHPTKKAETLPPLPAQIAEGLGWDYARLQKTVKEDPISQERWEQLEISLHDIMRRFVEAAQQPAFDSSALDRYLAKLAHIPEGQLQALWSYLHDLMGRILQEQEIQGLLRALNAGFIPPSPGNDVVRNDKVAPSGRNIHSLDPYRVPTPAAYHAAEEIVNQMLERLVREQGALPESIAMVLWGTDNLKSNCEGVAQVMWLLGARTIPDELGNVADVELIPLEELGRPRIDVVMTVSGIFRDLLHHQMNLLDKAVRMAAEADEPIAQNFVRKHAQAQADELGLSINEAATRVFCNAPGVYGANVNHLVESSNWEDDGELSEMFLTRKSYSFNGNGEWHNARTIMESSLATVNATFQNIDSFEMGISDVDHYYEYLGGVAKSVEKLSGKRPPVLVADAMGLNDRLASLEQMVRLESRTKLLNPKWYDSMLAHGYEGVREIETRVSNTYGWSATASAVEGWVYDDISNTFLLDEEMRQRMSQANPYATASIARRLLEAEARGFWDADDETIDRLREIYGELEDRMEGIVTQAG
jgi:magnesium chelatase subunit H